MPLSRRQLLLGGLGAAATTVALSRQPWEVLIGDQASRSAPAGAGGGILVLLTLYGGNDGLNTVIPYEDGAYLGARGAVGYQPNEVLALGDGLGLHPNLAGLKALWDTQRLAIVRGAGYPGPNRSHFRSMDIWQSAQPDDGVATGWVGRWLDATGTDPLRAISVGGTLPRAFGGERAAGAAVPTGRLSLPGGAAVRSAFAKVAEPTAGASPLAARVAQSGADLLTVERTIADLLAAQPPAEEDAEGANGVTSLEGAGAGNELVGQLDLVARLIKAGSPTRVYGVSLGGFDTHANEKDTHAGLLGDLDEAVTGFFKGLEGHATAERVVLTAYSEFGRRVAANASGGTDHGTAAPMFIAGSRVKGGFYGDEPSLTDLDAGDLRFTTDFRSVYATLLEDLLGIEAKASLGRPFKPVPFL